jgi:hypothetical protein
MLATWNPVVREMERVGSMAKRTLLALVHELDAILQELAGGLDELLDLIGHVEELKGARHSWEMEGRMDQRLETKLEERFVSAHTRTHGLRLVSSCPQFRRVRAG